MTASPQITPPVCPDLASAVGNTPLIRLNAASEATGCEIWGKAEFMNPGASVKDRAALWIIRDAIARGTLRPGGTILLHDTDCHAPHGDWRRTLAATRQLLTGPLASATLGPLGDHWRDEACENSST